MNYWIYVLVLAITHSNNLPQKTSNSNNLTSTQAPITIGRKAQNRKEACWTGTLNGKIPIFIHYQLDGNIIIGEITYLNTKDKLPIRLLGTVEEDKSYRLLEFDRAGNITGIIVGIPTKKEFNGSWISPKTEKELKMKLLPKDTSISSPPLEPDKNQIFGNYHYQYGKKGYNGDFECSKIDNNKAAFYILSLTNVERGPNIAEVEKDTITLTGDSFIYKIPGSDSCEFKVKFYKDFVYINYTRGYCESQFGLNATIDGIYVKTN
jgi:hypothetical protein